MLITRKYNYCRENLSKCFPNDIVNMIVENMEHPEQKRWDQNWDLYYDEYPREYYELQFKRCHWRGGHLFDLQRELLQRFGKRCKEYFDMISYVEEYIIKEMNDILV